MQWKKSASLRVRKSLAEITGFLAVCLLAVWASSWRKDTSALARLDRYVENGDRVLAVFWHGKFFPLFALARGRQAAVFISRSFRGEVIAAICRWFGYSPVFIRGGAGNRSLEHIEAVLRAGCSLAAMAVDGPLGPHHHPKPGAIRISADLGYRILPMSVSSHPKHVLRTRWDRREIPLPFAAVKLLVGEPIDVPAGLTHESLSHWQGVLRAKLEALDRERF